MAALRIKRVTIYTLRIPIPKERVHSPEFAYEPLNRGPTGKFDGTWVGDMPIYVVSAEGDGGEIGWGDMPRLADFAEMKTRASKLLGLTLDEVRADVDPTDEESNYRGLHTAALDWRTRNQGVPLHTVFGEKVRDQVKVAWWAGMRTPSGAADIARHAKSLGISSLKLKGNEILDDEGIARAVREACGDDFRVIIDPNGRWESPEQGIERAKRIHEANPNVWLEDPLYTGDGGNARIRHEGPIGMIRTCLGGAERVRKIVQADVADGLNIVGPWPMLLDESAEAARQNLPFWAGSSVMTGLDDFATLHFAATQPGFTLGADFAASQSRENNLITQPIRYVDGKIAVPTGPGMGVDINLDALERYRVADPVVVQ